MLNPRRLAAAALVESSIHPGDLDLNAVVSTVQLACAAPIAVINIVTEDLQSYAAEIGLGTPCTTVTDGLSFCAEVVNTSQPLVVADARAHPIYRANPFVQSGEVGAYAGVPLVDNGFVLGSVAIFHPEPHGFTDADLEILQHQARLAASVLALRRTARTDLLTGLPNRALFVDRLTQSIARLDREEGAIAVLFLDVDDFKPINDSWGHVVGDSVLVQLSRGLAPVLRSADTLARWGGDEFVAVCHGLSGRAEVESLADRLVLAASRSAHHAGADLALRISIGIVVVDSALATPTDALDAADAAMYRAKAEPGSAWIISDERPGCPAE